MNKNGKIVFLALIALSVLMAVFELTMLMNGLEVSVPVYSLWSFVFIVILVLWVNEDSKQHKEIYRPFEFGFLVFVFYIFYVPYYLIKTRGAIKGALFLVALTLFYKLGWLLQWLVFLPS